MTTHRSTQEKPAIRDLPRGPNGRALCRWCQTEVPKGRRSFCSQPCIDEWSIRSDPGFARHKVYERDKGVCAFCKLDCLRLKRALSSRYGVSRTRFVHLWFLVTGRKATAKFNGYRTLWETDHANPVSEGGGECGLDNLRTLCIWCHNEVTAHLRKRLGRATRAKRRKAKKPSRVACSVPRRGWW